MYVVAHIAGIPVEEWAPYVVPVLGLWLYGRRRDRRRRAAVERMPDPAQALDEDTVSRVLERWTRAKHPGLGPAHVPLRWPGCAGTLRAAAKAGAATPAAQALEAGYDDGFG